MHLDALQLQLQTLHYSHPLLLPQCVFVRTLPSLFGPTNIPTLPTLSMPIRPPNGVPWQMVFPDQQNQNTYIAYGNKFYCNISFFLPYVILLRMSYNKYCMCCSFSWHERKLHFVNLPISFGLFFQSFIAFSNSFTVLYVPMGSNVPQSGGLLFPLYKGTGVLGSQSLGMLPFFNTILQISVNPSIPQFHAAFSVSPTSPSAFHGPPP